MKINKDINIIYYIKKHFNDILSYTKIINTYELFLENIVYQKAIILDLIQIGENVNKLSDDIKSFINKKDLRGIINFRNQLVHGYENNDPDLIWNVIQNNLPQLVKEICEIVRCNYREHLKSLLNTEVNVIIDRPINSVHPNHNDIIYEVNYGYITSLIALDNEYQDAYVLGVNYPIKEFKGEVKAIIHRLNDNEDKLIVAPSNLNFEIEEIKRLINFQEKYFNIEIIKWWFYIIIFYHLSFNIYQIL